MPIELDDAPLRHTARSRLAALLRASRAASALAAEILMAGALSGIR